MTPSSIPDSPSRGAGDQREQQLRDLRFLESFPATLAGCGDLAAVHSSAAHRIAAAVPSIAVALLGYEPIAATLDTLHQTGARIDWDRTLLRRAIDEQRMVGAGGMLAVPVLSGGSAFAVWGVLALAREVAGGQESPPYTMAERQTLRAAAEKIAVELERRRYRLLDDVLDTLLRKTKPIDVYTHTLRDLRRFIRYDESASVITMQRGTAQLTVRVEKVVRARGETETLADSPRRGRSLRLTPAQTRFLGNLERPVELTNDGSGWHLANARTDPDAAGLWRVLTLDQTASTGSILCYPLVFGGAILGILRLASKRPGAFDPIGRYVTLLDRFARLLSVTLYRSELYHQSDRQLQAIKQIGRTITEPIAVEEVCQQVLQLALRVLHVQVGAVGLLSEEGRLELAAHHGCTEPEPPVLAVGEGISGHVVRTGTSRAVPNVHREPAYVVFNSRVCSELVAPITYNQEVIGFLDVASFEEGRFREEDEEVITFLEALANQAAIAIKSAQLHANTVSRLGGSLAIDPTLSMAGLQDLLVQELRDKNEQLAAANERLATASRAKSEFLAHMSHDLRGPLNVIVGLANLLTDPSTAASLDPEKQRESLTIIRSSGEVLASLIGTILDLSALEAGKVQLGSALFDAQTAFGYLRAMAQTLAGESLRELDISMVLDPQIVTLRADEEKFMRIMINLISNAVKFTPSGGRIEVTAVVENGESSGNRSLHVAVADTGVGIPLEHQETIFEPFRQLKGTAAGEHRGSGLGLAVVRQLVELHGGRVWVEGAPGLGSTFHLHLPDAVPAAERPVEAPLDVEPLPADPALPWSRGTVLVVEDTEAHMNLMRLAVTSRGYTLHGVTSGEDALIWLESNRPDVILLDMQLPGIDGFSVAARIKGQVETHAIPVIAVTADALAVNEERARASGCDAYLTKPIDLAALLRTIEAVSR